MREMDGPQPARRPAPGSGAKGLAGRSDVMGPLMGIRVVEMAGIGPGPFAGMLLSDLGAEVIRVDRPGGGGTLGANPADVTGRGRRSIAVNLKHADGVEAVLRLVEKADLLIEGFRPDRKSTRLNSSHVAISYAVFCLKKKTQITEPQA